MNDKCKILNDRLLHLTKKNKIEWKKRKNPNEEYFYYKFPEHDYCIIKCEYPGIKYIQTSISTDKMQTVLCREYVNAEDYLLLDMLYNAIVISYNAVDAVIEDMMKELERIK